MTSARTKPLCQTWAITACVASGANRPTGDHPADVRTTRGPPPVASGTDRPTVWSPRSMSVPVGDEWDELRPPQ